MAYEDIVVKVQEEVDYILPAICVNGMMTIMSDIGAIYITKEQAMQFFDLVENSKYIEQQMMIRTLSRAATMNWEKTVPMH
jgi:hypothetical protein